MRSQFKWVIIALGLLAWALLADPAHAQGLHWRAEGRIGYGNGVTVHNSPQVFSQFMADHPDIETLVFEDMPGSENEAANLVLARQIRRLGLNTHLRADSEIASGATDLFIAGVKRTIECGAMFGVHSWRATQYTDTGQLVTYTARDIARDPYHRDHKPYIHYFEEMDISAEFYWFTVDQAPFEGMYYMTAKELERFEIVSQPMRCSSN